MKFQIELMYLNSPNYVALPLDTKMDLNISALFLVQILYQVMMTFTLNGYACGTWDVMTFFVKKGTTVHLYPVCLCYGTT